MLWPTSGHEFPAVHPEGVKESVDLYRERLGARTQIRLARLPALPSNHPLLYNFPCACLHTLQGVQRDLQRLLTRFVTRRVGRHGEGYQPSVRQLGTDCPA